MLLVLVIILFQELEKRSTVHEVWIFFYSEHCWSVLQAIVPTQQLASLDISIMAWLPRWYLLHWVSLFLNLQVQFVDDLYLTCCVILWSLWPITFQFSHMFRGLFGSEALAFRKYFHPEFPALHSTMGWRSRPLFTDFFRRQIYPLGSFPGNFVE